MRYVLVAILLFAVAGIAQADTHYVIPGESIQAAITAADPGDTIQVAAGTYEEQIELNKNNLVLQGAGQGSTIILSPAVLGTKFTTSSANMPIVYVSAQNATIRSLTVNGAGRGNGNVRFEGVAFYNSGGMVESVTITDVRETPLSGGQHGVAIYVYNQDGASRNIAVTDCTIAGYQKNAMAVSGAGLTAVVTGNTITGAGPTALIVQNGIQLSYGATGTIKGNTVSGNYWTGTYGGSNDPTTDPEADGSAGILLYESSGTVDIGHNTLTGNQFGIWTVAAVGIDVYGNSITGASGTGIAVWDSDMWSGGGEVGTTGSIHANTISSHVYGLIFRDFTLGGAVPNVGVHYNSITGNSSQGVWSNLALNGETNWWGAKDGPGPVGPGSGDNVSANVDYDPWLTTPYVSLAFEGSRLAQTQNTDGGWGWPLTGGSAQNTVGPIGMGLARAYRASEDLALLTALQKASDFLLAKTNTFSPSDGYLAAELDSILGGTANRNHVKANYYDKLANGTFVHGTYGGPYNTRTYIEFLRNRRSGSQANIAAWDLGMGIVGASSSGADTTEWIAGAKAEINELAAGDYDVIGLAGALYGLAYVKEEFDPTAGLFASASNLTQLAAQLATYQLSTGGFAWSTTAMVEGDDNETIQETGYSILALNTVGGHGTAISDAIAYMKSVQLTTGGWEDYAAGGENNEVTAEAAWGISAENLLYLDAPKASLYVKPGETFEVDMNVANLQQVVSGCQAMLGYNSTYLDATGVAPGGDVWDLLIYAKYDVPGEIDTAIGVKAETTSGTDEDGTVAKITMNALSEGTTRVVFRPDADPDPGLVKSTFLSDMSADIVWPNKWDSQTIVIDGTPPTIEIASVTPVNVGDGGCALQGRVDITVTAGDSLSGLAGPPEVTVSGMTVTYDGENPMGMFNYHVTVDATTANGSHTVNASVADKAGWVSNAAPVDFCVNKNRITGSVELQQYIGAARTVTFVATGGVVTKTWTFTATGTVTPFTLTDVPEGSTRLSAKANWNLRRRVTLGSGTDGQWTADLTGDNKLLGGDLNGSNSINILDYAVLKINWMKPMPGAAVADITGDAVVNTSDYNIMRGNWFMVGDPQ